MSGNSKRADELLREAELLLEQGELAQTAELFERAAELYDQLKDALGLGRAHLGWAQALWRDNGHEPQSIEHFQFAADVFEAVAT